jgi:replicative DNA helicase
MVNEAKIPPQALDFYKIPPQAVDFEESVLGAVMIEKDILNEITGSIAPEDFYLEIHQIIFSAILDLDRNNKPIDILTVTESLRNAGKLNEVEGPAYIAHLSGKVATGEHIAGHARIIKQKSIQRKFIEFGNDLVKKAYTNNIEDLIVLTNDKLEEITESLYKTEGIELKDSIDDFMKEAQQRQELYKRGEFIGICTPLVELTRLTGGFQRGELIVLAGRPSMGKTALALAAAKKAAQEGNYVLLFSLEMKAIRLSGRLMTGESEVDPNDVKRGKISEQDWQRLENASGILQDKRIRIYDDPLMNIEYIRARSRVMSKKRQCDMIIIDYLGMIYSKPEKNQLREQVVADISRRSKSLAGELDVPVILVSQLNRSCELRSDKRPHLSDLRESGAIEQDADLVGLIFRPEYYEILEYADNISTKNTGELNIAKNRNGETKTIKFKYNESMTQIYDMPRPGEIEPVDNKDFKTSQYADN